MEILVIGAAMAVVGVGFWYFSAANRLKRELRAARVWPIGELPENTIGRVIGEAHPIDRVLEGPLSGRACVYYVARVEEEGSNSWKTVIEEHDGVPFLLDDGSGRAIVDPVNAEVVLTFDSDSSSGTFDDATRTEEAFLAKHGRSSTGWVFNKKLRYTEAIIEPGETIAVLGSGVREPDPQAMPGEGYRSAPPTRLRLTSSRQHPLRISDDPSTTQR
jgi:hypothetical protein